MSEEQYRAALDAAARQLSYRALSAAALRDKLIEKGHSEDAADYAVAWLIERRLLDDAAYAESVVRSYARRGYGAARIRQELTRRGVDRGTAEAALLGYAPERAHLAHSSRKIGASHWQVRRAPRALVREPSPARQVRCYSRPQRRAVPAAVKPTEPTGNARR